LNVIDLAESPAQAGTLTPGRADPPLYMLAFDHRRSIRGLFGVRGEPSRAESARIADAKRVIGDGLLEARERVGSGEAALLVDEQYGAAVLDLARERGVVTALACERSGQAEFQFEYAEAVGAHIERFDPTFVKTLVRFNPGGDEALNRRQLDRLRELSDLLAAGGRKLLFELLVPPEAGQLRSVGDDRDRYDAEVRPELVCRAVAAVQEAGIEPAVWKIEGIEERRDCERIAAVCRREGRERVSCLILGRGADHSRVEHWLRVAAPVDGFGGFAIGRTIWWEAIAAQLAGELDRAAAVATIAERYLHFVDVYRAAAQPVATVRRRPAPG
jgi:myo-inositol catabolism protein IolC